MRNSIRKTVSTIGATLLVFSLAACKEEVVPQPVVTNTAEAAISADKYTQIAKTTQDALANADTALSTDSVAPRAQNPFLAQRAAQYKLKGLKEDFSIPMIVIDAEAEPVESGADFPRSLFSYSAPVSGQNQRTLTAWQQSSARSNYKLWGQVALFAQSDLPALISTANDATAIPAGQPEKYLADPAAVLAAYAEYVNTGAADAVPFQAGDSVATQLQQNKDKLNEEAGEFGTITLSSAADQTGIVGVSTADGGVVIMGNLLFDIKYEANNEDRPLILKDEVALMASGDKEKDTAQIVKDKPLTAHYATTLAFYIPPKAAGDTKAETDAAAESAQDAAPTVRLIGASTPVLLSAEIAQ